MSSVQPNKPIHNLKEIKALQMTWYMLCALFGQLTFAFEDDCFRIQKIALGLWSAACACKTRAGAGKSKKYMSRVLMCNIYISYML